MSEELIPDSKLKSLWKQSITASLSPDNDFHPYKLYYILLKKEIIENYRKTQTQEINQND